MCTNLRKVTFSLGHYELMPDATEEEESEMKELAKVRRGYFHRWVDEEVTITDIPHLKPMALVEDVETGKIHCVEYYNITFTEDWI